MIDAKLVYDLSINYLNATIYVLVVATNTVLAITIIVRNKTLFQLLLLNLLNKLTTHAPLRYRTDQTLTMHLP